MSQGEIQLQQILAAIANTNAAILQFMQQQAANPAGPVTQNITIPAVAKEIGIKPSPFKGDDEHYFSFLQRTNSYLGMNAGVYDTDRKKVNFFLGLMEAGAATWADLWHQQIAASVAGTRVKGSVTYLEVTKSFENLFGGRDQQKQAREKLKHLR